MWAHAEYLKLLRSVSDGRVFDLIPEVAARYLMPRTARRVVQVWTFFCPALTTPRGATLRIVAEVPFLLHWSMEDWQDSSSRTVLTGVHFVDIDVSSTGASAVTFTFYWPEAARWEGRDFRVDVS